jgi:hypothetical protein
LRTTDCYSTGRQAGSINPILFDIDGGNDFHSRRTQRETQAERRNIPLARRRFLNRLMADLILIQPQLAAAMVDRGENAGGDGRGRGA